MKKLAIATIFGAAFAIALGFGFVPGIEQTASCAECESDNLPGIKKAFLSFDEECKKQLTSGEDQKRGCFVSNVYNKIVPILGALSKDNRFGPGDRILIVGQAQNGNLLAGTNRAFQTVAPLDKDSLTIEVNKTDGGNGALVKICTVDEDGKLTRVGTIRFEENNETGKKQAVVTGTKGKIVRIDFNSFGGALKKFKYTLKTL
jgi:hypothetical protein